MLGERLSEIRKDHGHTQADLADQLGVSLFTVRAWEQGKSAPNHDMLVTLCRLYHVSSDYLLGLSNVDPVYVQRHRLSQFSADDLRSLAEYEAFLLWRQNHK